jgi:hypothetical protein
MNEFHSWFYVNSLIINTEKALAMSFYAREGRDLVKPQTKFGNEDIAYKSETSSLGIHIGEYMKWNVHTRSLSSKLSKFCYMIKFLKDVTSPSYKKYLFFIFSW